MTDQLDLLTKEELKDLVRMTSRVLVADGIEGFALFVSDWMALR